MGGQERFIYLLSRGLDRERFDLDVVALMAGGYWAGKIAALGVSVLELERNHKFELRRLASLVRHLRSRRSELLYSLGFSANMYGRFAGLIAGVPHMIAGWRGVEATPYHRVMETILRHRTDRVICNSEAIRRDVLLRSVRWTRRAAD